jgi:hypothetical protein
MTTKTNESESSSDAVSYTVESLAFESIEIKGVTAETDSCFEGVSSGTTATVGDSGTAMISQNIGPSVNLGT